MKDKIRVGISACLLGEKVRYDGGHKLDHYLNDTLGAYIEWVPVCPETETGLPVPREPMHLVGDPEKPRLITIRTGIDITERMQKWSEIWLEKQQVLDLQGFVFKSGSPSCGVQDVDVFGSAGQSAGRGRGLFCAAVMKRFTIVTVEDEIGLQNTIRRNRFLDRLGCFGDAV